MRRSSRSQQQRSSVVFRPPDRERDRDRNREPAPAAPPSPRPAQYVPASPAAARASIPRIVQASVPTPPRSTDRLNGVRIQEGGSPRGSRASLSSHGSRRPYDVVYVSRSRERQSTGAGDRLSRSYLTPTGREDEVVDSFATVEPARQTTMLLEAGNGRRRGTSITSGPRISRERIVVVGEDGRRRETYRKL